MSGWDSEYKKALKSENKAAKKAYAEKSAKNTAMSNAYVADQNAIVDQGVANATGKIQQEIDKLPTAYQYGYDMNAIQQKINEREAAEVRANLGQTDSGLNRTQQTAINVQRSNADAALTQKKMAATASLKQQIADAVANGELQKMGIAADARASLEKTNQSLYDSLYSTAENNARTAADNWQAQQTAIEKAVSEATKGTKTDTANTTTYKTPTKEILQKALSIKLSGGDVDAYLQGLSAYDVEAIDDFVNTYSNVSNWNVKSNGGNNYGKFLGIFGDAGIDEDGVIASHDGHSFTLKEFYNGLIAAGMKKDQAKDYVVDLQQKLGIAKK